MKIIRYGGCDDIDVEFLDEHHYIKEHQSYVNFKSGSIKNPYDKSKYGIGYIGVGRHRAKVNGQYNYIYDVWADMINRCYHSKDRFSAYYGTCTVCEEWLNFQVFADWYEAHEYPVNERLHLDKDILLAGNKEYAPKKCMLVPQRLNMMFMNKSNDKGLPNGVRRYANKYCAKYNSKELGSFNTVEEAYKAYTDKKKEAIVDLANEYKGIIPQDVYDAIIAYEFDIRNDKNYKVA